MANTAIVFPTGPTTVNVFTNSDGKSSPATITAPSGNPTTELSSGFVLYVPFSVTSSTSVNVSALTSALGGNESNSLGVFTYQGSAAAKGISSSTVALDTGTTLLVPVASILPEQVVVASFLEALSAAASSTNPAPSQGQAAGSDTGSTATALSSPSNTSSKIVSPTQTSAGGVSKTTFNGALAGGIVGAFIGGLLCCLLAFWCMKRRSSHRRPRQSDSEDSNHISPVAAASSSKKEPRVIESEMAAGVIGWEKHLPQEKDDGTVIRSLKSVFEDIQTYMEGTYEAKQEAASDANIRTLQRLWAGEFPKELLQTSSAVPILEGVLIRDTIYRISGRSVARESLLPDEFSRICRANKWHMEKDAQEIGHAQEDRRGFPQAFSQWRRLTRFLGTDSKTDLEFKKELDVKIDHAARSLIEAFSPWEIPGSSNANIKENLRGILHKASDLGILLFSQPSTFMFDWTNKHCGNDRSVVLAPALVKRLNESAQAFKREQVLVEARYVQ